MDSSAQEAWRQHSDPHRSTTGIRYAYIGEVGEICAVKLLRLAHRYQMPQLVASCAEAMLEQLSEENVAEVVCSPRGRAASGIPCHPDRGRGHWITGRVREDGRVSPGVVPIAHLSE